MVGHVGVVVAEVMQLSVVCESMLAKPGDLFAFSHYDSDALLGSFNDP